MNPVTSPMSPGRLLQLLALIVGMLLLPVAPLVSAQGESMPPTIPIDALDGYRWSDQSVAATPGQVLVVTNRDVERHTFTIDEWGVNESLPTLVAVEIGVPDDAEVGSTVTFYSAIAEDQDEGMEGIIHVVSPDEVAAEQESNLVASRTVSDRFAIEIGDDFTFTPSSLDVQPGAFLEVRNVGVIEHHFVIDDWFVNETIPAGDIAIVQIPEEAAPGQAFTFYCSVPGHSAQGMTGTITVIPRRQSVETISPDERNLVHVSKDLRPFVPDAAFLGTGWSQLRTGDAGSLLAAQSAMPPEVFPSEGIGAIYVGPQGSRVTLIVLPVTDQTLPANQVRDAIAGVQQTMTGTWDRDRIASAAYVDVAPPPGCDIAYRASGIVPVLTIPAGATACQMRGAGIAIFVTVEGSLGNVSGVAAADEVIELLLTRA